MPLPTVIHWQRDTLLLQHRLRFEWRRYQDPLLLRAADRFTHRLTLRTGIDIVGDASVDDSPITITIDCSAPDANFLTVNEDDHYRLVVTATGVSIEAPGQAGVLRALATLLQLVQTNGHGYSFRQVSIEDQPRFAWRGLMIDVSRHFMPIELAVAAAKRGYRRPLLFAGPGARADRLRARSRRAHRAGVRDARPPQKLADRLP
jgi:hexosaminidase